MSWIVIISILVLAVWGLVVVLMNFFLDIYRGG